MCKKSGHGRDEASTSAYLPIGVSQFPQMIVPAADLTVSSAK
jgi:hypothetical protein